VAGVRSGGARCEVRVSLAPGLHVVEARYLGSHEFLGSLARTTVRVLRAAI
jgi:hypothetical protein